jgi:hypothetical protein
VISIFYRFSKKLKCFLGIRILHTQYKMDEQLYQQKLNTMNALARDIIKVAIGEWRTDNSSLIEQEYGVPSDYDNKNDYYEQVAELMTEGYDKLDDVFSYRKASIDYYDPIERYLKVKGIDYENIFDKELMIDEVQDSLLHPPDGNSDFDDIVRAYIYYVSGCNNDYFDWYDFEYFKIE